MWTQETFGRPEWPGRETGPQRGTGPQRETVLLLRDSDKLLSSGPFHGDSPMASRASAVALLLALLPMAGCGTAANLVNSHPETGGRVPFGGVMQDMWCLDKAASGEFGLKECPKAESQQYSQRALMLFCAADLPLSFVGDVVTWPYTTAFTFINEPIPLPPVLMPPTAAVEVPQMPPLEMLPDPRKLP